MSDKFSSWKAVWEASPGPKTRREYVFLFLKGFCMGTADIIPGVSGGTIAFITGIYEQLLSAIASIDLKFLSKLSRFDLKGAFAEIHLRFIIALGLGIAIAIFSTARLMHYLITQYPVLTWAAFFGLILASIVIVSRKIDNWMGKNFIFAVIGVGLAYWIVGLIPTTTPETWWFLILSGAIAVSAMLLPGLSGSFILLVLGKYEFITGAIKNPFSVDSIVIILLVGVGLVIGLIGFSRVLRTCLDRYHDATMALLTGIMIGALRKVWPWKEVLETKVIRGKVHVLHEANILPTQFDMELLFALALAILGLVFILVLEKISNSSAHS